jgi:hypothetical protein
MLRIITTFTLASMLFACGGAPAGDAKKDAKAEVKKDAPVAAPEAPKTAPAPEKKSEFKPDEAWTTLSTMSHMDRMTNYRDGVTITGAVAKVVDDPAGEYGLQMDAGGGNTIELHFQDFGKAAKDKKIAAGATVTGTKCSPTNAEGTKMAFVGCELK